MLEVVYILSAGVMRQPSPLERGRGMFIERGRGMLIEGYVTI